MAAEEAVRVGVTLRNVHNHIGVSGQTFWNWIRRGNAGEQPYARFVERVNKARAECEVATLRAMQAAGGQDPWQSKAWLLERSFSYRKDVDNDVPPVAAGARTEEEAVDLLARMPSDLLEAALAKKRGGK